MSGKYDIISKFNSLVLRSIIRTIILQFYDALWYSVTRDTFHPIQVHSHTSVLI